MPVAICVICSNCQGPLASGGAKGLCGRCYRYHHRNGALPPAESLHTGKSEELSVKLEPLLLRHAIAAAKREGVTLREFARRALSERCLRLVGRAMVERTR